MARELASARLILISPESKSIDFRLIQDHTVAEMPKNFGRTNGQDFIGMRNVSIALDNLPPVSQSAAPHPLAHPRFKKGGIGNSNSWDSTTRFGSTAHCLKAISRDFLLGN